MASKQNKRRSSTFAQRTNAHFKAIERQINPQPTFGSISGDPPAITSQGKFIDRVVYVSPGTDKLYIGSICQALKSAELSGSGPSGDFYIRSIKIWGAPYASNLNNVVIKFILNNLLVAASGNADPVIVRDYGSGARRPGVRCSIPMPAARLQNFDTTSEVVVAELLDGSNCIHVSVRQKL